MKILGRKPVSKNASARTFRHNVSRSNVMNLKPRPMRGGIRM